MSLQITNSLSRKKEPFIPMEEGKVKLYVCGPTVYNFIHIGNARPLVFFDVVRRYLEASGFQVTHVMNYTDVDDKIINRAEEEKTTFNEIVAKYIHEYETDMRSLGVLTPHKMPRVSEHIPQIIKLIENIIKNGTAYVVDGEVFFAVRNFPSYGKLSGKNIDELESGARVEINQKKKDPLDFSLWKPAKPGEPSWDSPWGKGRPGWHIECSAMAMQYLGETFDVHGGGMDLIHPHHENEIAQSEAGSHKPFVRFWMHNNMLNMNAEKMSKSLGNFLLTREFVEKYGAEVLKFMLLSGHYRSMIDFGEKSIQDSQSALHRYYQTVRRCEAVTKTAGAPKASAKPSEFEASWRAAMDDDFNTAKVNGLIFDLVRQVNTDLDKKKNDAAQRFLDDMKKLSGVLNLYGEDCTTFLEGLKDRIISQRNISRKQIEELIQKRIDARQKKDFKTADEIRKQCTDMGIELRDQGTASTEWDVLFT